MKIRAYKIEITGIVQGVGFRPYIFKLAKEMSLVGFVTNVGDRVEVVLECLPKREEEFIESLKENLPGLSEIREIFVEETEYTGYSDFFIAESSEGVKNKIFISPDISVCNDCINELMDKTDMRYKYPFINCTNCGPRFSIIEDIPYDRKNTTMEEFEMCDSCKHDYFNPEDRRYHAQPTACNKCGPKLIFRKTTEEKYKCEETQKQVALNNACKMITMGKIIAIKGIGGYHLACLAENKSAVIELRKRKKRDRKPFAIMVKDVDTAAKYCEIDDFERQLLESNKSPIVLLKKNKNCKLPEEIAYNNKYLGVMLPYTPLHYLIFDLLSKNTNQVVSLIMTSGNICDEPIYFNDEEAFEKLADIADGFLFNNRKIYLRTDDSVTRALNNREYIIRRSRGYVPSSIKCDNIFMEDKTSCFKSVLSFGAELKNTFCVNKENEFFPSHHIGDLENVETLKSFEDGIEHFFKMLNIKADLFAYDMHPDYLSTKYAKRICENKTKMIAIQHHEAHIASCIADNDIAGSVIGVAFDGTGYGDDGNIWGGEFFTGDCTKFKRQGHLKYIEMPGGDVAIREPWRMAVSYLHQINDSLVCEIFNGKVKKDIETINQMISNKINTPLTSSVGRLFDAVSALLGFTEKIQYEGQAACELEYMANNSTNEIYDYEIIDCENHFEICVNDTIKGIISDIKNNISNEIISTKFHNTVSETVLESCKKIRMKTGLNRVVLSGGVFQNMILLEQSVGKLKSGGFEVFTHSRVPTNDGGISLGQAIIALKQNK